MSYYSAEYKCRRCGKVFHMACMGGEIAPAVINEVVIDGMSTTGGPLRVTEESYHTCADKSLGYADFIGLAYCKEVDDL